MLKYLLWISYPDWAGCTLGVAAKLRIRLDMNFQVPPNVSCWPTSTTIFFQM
jgi:hypothetical protein